MKVEARSSKMGERKIFKHWQPMKTWMSPRVKGVVSDGLSVYSLGCKRKKNVIQIMLAVDAWSGDLARAVDART